MFIQIQKLFLTNFPIQIFVRIASKKSKGFRNTVNYSKAPISENLHIDVTKRSEISDNSGLDITKHMDDSAQSFLDSDANPYKKVIPSPFSHFSLC